MSHPEFLQFFQKNTKFRALVGAFGLNCCIVKLFFYT
jgi:hypothetical protein